MAMTGKPLSACHKDAYFIRKRRSNNCVFFYVRILAAVSIRGLSLQAFDDLKALPAAEAVRFQSEKIPTAYGNFAVSSDTIRFF